MVSVLGYARLPVAQSKILLNLWYIRKFLPLSANPLHASIGEGAHANVGTAGDHEYGSVAARSTMVGNLSNPAPPKAKDLTTLKISVFHLLSIR